MGSREEFAKMQQRLEDANQRILLQQKLIDENGGTIKTMSDAGIALEREIQILRSKNEEPKIKFHSTIGSLSEFRIGEDWEIYETRLTQYFIANDVPEEKMVATLITLIGSDAFKILNDLCDPIPPYNKTFKELCGILKKQFAPKIAIYKERLEFYNLTQGENESVNQWFARVKSKAVNCKFGTILNEILKDRFVTGLRRGQILDRVCEADHTTELETLVDIAQKKEAAVLFSKQASTPIHQIQYTTKEGTGAKKKNPTQVNKKGTKAQNKDSTCNHCGGTQHDFGKCKYREYKCKICKKLGHLARICRNKTSNSKETHFMGNFDEHEDIGSKFVNMFHIENDENVEPSIIQIHIGGVPIKVEIDSGAGKSIMPEDLFQKWFPEKKLHEATTKLKFYDGTIVKPLGQFETSVEYKKTITNGTFIVVKRGARTLLGRDLMSKLGFIINHIHHIQGGDEELDNLLWSFPELFDGKLGRSTGGLVELTIKDGGKPVYHKPRPLPFAMKDKVGKKLDEMERQGVISKINDSEWGTPLVPVIKANGDLRICGDYKVTINRMIEDVKEPLPRIEEIFAELGGGENFTKLDLAAAYNQLEVTDETKKLLAWSTHQGIYAVNRLPFGPKPAGAIFQRQMRKVLQGTKGTVSYMDDITVTGKNKAEHLRNLREVLRRLSEAGFKLNLEKCKFFQEEITFLGHRINRHGLFKDEKKIEAVVNAPCPKNPTQVKAFIGMVNYCGKFIPNLAKILSPLYKLQDKNSFNWTEECQNAFLEVKREITADRNLSHFDPELPLKLVCDASNDGIGAALLHVYQDGSERPIAFASRVLRQAEKNYAAIHKEALAVYWGVCKFYQYLMGREFLLCSDHKPLSALFGEHRGIPTMAAGRLQRWALFLSGFNYKFQYIKGKDNGAANGLSRLPLSTTETAPEEHDYLNFICEDKIPISADDIAKATRVDPELSKVFLYVRDGWPSEGNVNLKPYLQRANKLSIERGVLMWGYRVLIPEKFRKDLLEEMHGAHLGMNKMKAIARQYFWWPNLDANIEEFVRSCDPCGKFAKKPEKARLEKFPQANRPFERIHIDFLGPFNGKVYFVVIDAYSKWPEIFEMTSTDTGRTLEKLREVFSRFGLPETLISDNGTQFQSAEFAEFCKNNGIRHRTSAPYHPATNGQAENMVGTFKNCLKRILEDKKYIGVNKHTLI